MRAPAVRTDSTAAGDFDLICDYDAMRKQLAGELMNLTDPQTGRKVINRVYRREELFWPVGTGCPDIHGRALSNRI